MSEDNLKVTYFSLFRNAILFAFIIVIFSAMAAFFILVSLSLILSLIIYFRIKPTFSSLFYLFSFL